LTIARNATPAPQLVMLAELDSSFLLIKRHAHCASHPTAPTAPISQAEAVHQSLTIARLASQVTDSGKIRTMQTTVYSIVKSVRS